MIDGHIHYIEYMGADRLNQIVEEYHYDGIALQCIPDSAGREVAGGCISLQRTVSGAGLYIWRNQKRIISAA